MIRGAHKLRGKMCIASDAQWSFQYTTWCGLLYDVRVVGLSCGNERRCSCVQTDVRTSSSRLSTAPGRASSAQKTTSETAPMRFAGNWLSTARHRVTRVRSVGWTGAKTTSLTALPVTSYRLAATQCGARCSQAFIVASSRRCSSISQLSWQPIAAVKRSLCAFSGCHLRRNDISPEFSLFATTAVYRLRVHFVRISSPVWASRGLSRSSSTSRIGVTVSVSVC